MKAPVEEEQTSNSCMRERERTRLDRLRQLQKQSSYFRVLTTICGIITLIVASFPISRNALLAWENTKRASLDFYDSTIALLPRSAALTVVEPDQASIEAILDQVSKELDLDPAILRAMAIQESGKYSATNLIRYEPQLLQSNGRRPQIVPPKELSEIERQLWASSHGLLQVVFGFHYKECKLGIRDWAKLYNPLINARCGGVTLKNYAARYRGTVKNQAQRLWFALRDYNNSDEYANQVARRIASIKEINYGDGI